MKQRLCLLLVLLLAATMVVLPAMAEQDMLGNMYLTGLPIVKEPVVYDAVINVQGKDTDPAQTALIQNLAKETGVSFNWTVLTNAETSERMATIMASGDLPDVFINVLGNSDRLIYGPAGALLPINEYLEYMPNFAAALEQEPAAVAQLTCPDGNIYSIPQINMYSTWPGNGVNSVGTVSINSLWKEALNIEIPTTTDELYEVLKAFRDDDPNGNGEKDEIPLAFLHSEPSNYSDSGFMYGPFGIVGPARHLNVENGKVFYAIQDERFIDAIKWFRQLYTEGLIDPEVFTMDGARYKAKVLEGNYGFYIDAGGNYYNNIVPEPIYEWISPVTGPNGDCVYGNMDLGVNANYCMISATAENPEILCRYFDNLFTPDNSFQVLWGTFESEFSDKGEDGTYIINQGNSWYVYDNLWKNTIRVLPGYVSNDMVYNLIKTHNTDTGVTTDKVHGEYQYGAAMMNAPYAVKEYYPNILLSTDANERIAILSTPILNAMNEKEIAWIMGQSDIEEEYDAFMAELEAMGLSEMVQIYQDAYDAVKK